MTIHDKRVSSQRHSAEQASGRSNRPPDGPEILELANRLVVFTRNGNHIAALMEKACKAIPMLTTAEVVQRIASHSPDYIWAIANRGKFDIESPEGEGYHAFLRLSEEGLQGLLDGSRDRKNSLLSRFTTKNEKAAKIDIWHAYAPGLFAAAISLVCRKIRNLRNQDANIFFWATNYSTARFVEATAFRKFPAIASITEPPFHVLRRSALSLNGAARRPSAEDVAA